MRYHDEQDRNGMRQWDSSTFRHYCGIPPPAHLGSIADRFRGLTIPWRHLMTALHCATWRYLMVVSHGGNRSVQLQTVYR